LFVKKSEEALRMEQDEYGRGEGDLLHLIAAEQAAIRAKADWAHAWNKYHNAAWQLSAAIGTVYQDLCVLQGI
jgi:outer membrane protein TolC